MEQFSLAALVGYILGSIPTAYLLVRWKSQLDIRTAGSGNVGTVNSYEVTKSGLLAGVVLLVDFAKDAAAVAVVRTLFTAGPDPGCWGALGAVVGHNYPVWLRGKGGRGLATAAGGALLTFWGLIPAWLTSWAVAFAVLRQVNPASAVACVLTITTVLASPTLLPGSHQVGALTPGLYTALLMMIILLRLVDPVRSYLVELKRERSSR